MNNLSVGMMFHRVHHSLAGDRCHTNVHGIPTRIVTTSDQAHPARVFDRLPDGYKLTAQGEELRNQLRGVSEQIERAQRSLSGRDLSLSGAIRVTTTDTLMHGLLMPYLAEFRALNPAMQMEIVINNTFLNMTRREADIAVRPSNIVPENLVGRRVGRLRSAIYASKSYLKKNPKKEWTVHDWGRARRYAVASRPSEMDGRKRSGRSYRGPRR